MRFVNLLLLVLLVFPRIVSAQSAGPEVTLRTLAESQRAMEMRKFQQSLRAEGVVSSVPEPAPKLSAAEPPRLIEKVREVSEPRSQFNVMSIFGPIDNLTVEFSTQDGRAGYLRKGDVFLGQVVVEVRGDGLFLQGGNSGAKRFVKLGDSLR